jgi:hypothetical protein
LLVLALLWPLLLVALRRAQRIERLIVIVISGFVAHAAWHWLVERFDAFSRADFGSLDAAFAAQAAAWLFAVLAVLLLGWAVLRRRPAPGSTLQPQVTRRE